MPRHVRTLHESTVDVLFAYLMVIEPVQTEKFYFTHKRSFSPENFAQKCRKLSQIIMGLIRWSGFSLVDDPQTQ